MRGVRVVCAIATVIVAAALVSSLAPQASAQQRKPTQAQNAAEFARLYRDWQQTKDTEQQLALLEQLTKLEPALKRWPLGTPRVRVKGELLHALGNAYQASKPGDRAKNLEKAIGAYESALVVRTRKVFPKDWADTQHKLGNAYQDRILGDQADNLEKAIGAYQAALTLITRDTRPHDWARIRNDLGLAYLNRIHGDRADNPEKAIGAFEAALTVITREAQPRDWADVQENLGLAYQNRVHGDRADNVEKTIAAYEMALTVFTRESSQDYWVRIQHNLGLAYQDRVRGDRADNLEKAIGAYQAALTVRTREALPREWATTQTNLGNAYWQRILGDRVDNLEKAIGAYQAALTVFTREALPREWAATQNNLGNAYLDRILGDRADNLEKAIGALQAALTVTTREASPREWAETQTNLGNAYGQRILGDRADNLEKAIGTLQAALTVFTREALPREWATTQTNLGNAYLGRILGDRVDNLEKAIGAYQAALTVRTREALPREWATTQTNLGLAYGQRILGDRVDNLEKAIGALQAALTVFTREASPREWAETQNNLGLAYEQRILGDRADNLEKAIGALQAALTVTTREASPREWAETQTNLGNAYGQRILGDRADNLEKAIGTLQAALTVFTREALPREWATTQTNLGNAYLGRILGDRADNLEKAIGAYQAALTVRTREALPREWAGTQNNLGNAYWQRILGDRADNLEKAIGASQAALTVFTREALPRDHLRTARFLGGALVEAREWHKAGLAYASAREAFLLLFGQGLNDAEARDLIAAAGPLFAEAAFAAAQRGEAEAALRLADEGRGRQRRVALRRQAVELPPSKQPQYAQLTAGIRAWERLAETAKGTEAIAALEQLAALRKQLGELLATHLNKDPGLTPALIPEGGAIVVPVVTRFGGKLLLATAGQDGPHIMAVDLPQLDSQRLDKLMRGDRSKVGAAGGWLGAYQVQYLKGQELQDRFFPEWIGAIDKVGPDLWALFGGVLDRALKERGVKPGTRIVLLPAGSLGLLPLGLAQEPGSGRRLGDTYEMVYAPSLEALAAASRQLADPPDPSLAAVVNPTSDLPFTEVEGVLVAAHFSRMIRRSNRIDRFNATPEVAVAAVKNRSYWHFASHGKFEPDDVRASGLLMRDEERLSIGRLLGTEGSLGRPRLVVLSACETGLYDIERNPEEFVGFPATFMQIGAAGVVSSLWPVDDLATALLIAKFYDLHMQERLAPPTALRGAQAWLREATRGELIAYARAAATRAKLDPARLGEIETDLAGPRRALRRRIAAPTSADSVAAPPPESQAASEKDRMQSRPFQHPYYWGGFIYTGL